MGSAIQSSTIVVASVVFVAAMSVVVVVMPKSAPKFHSKFAAAQSKSLYTRNHFTFSHRRCSSLLRKCLYIERARHLKCEMKWIRIRCTERQYKWGMAKGRNGKEWNANALSSSIYYSLEKCCRMSRCACPTHKSHSRWMVKLPEPLAIAYHSHHPSQKCR